MTELTREQIINGLKIHADRTSDEGWHARAIYMHAAARLLEGETAPAETNNRLKRTMEFDLTDAPALMAAFRLKACEAMLCGHPGAKERFDHYKKLMDALVPPESRYFGEEEWSEIGAALAVAESFTVTLEPKRWERDRSWWHDGVIVITIGERRWESSGLGAGHSGYFKRGAPEIEAVYKVLSDLAPLGCEGTFDNQKEERAW